MRLLLDTNVLIWAATDDGTLSESTRRAIEQAEVAAVSAVSALEISLKQNIGKLTPVMDDFVAAIEDLGYATMAITAQHGWAAGALPLHHRDPFDRILVAQAQLEGLTIVTRDPIISRYQVATLAA
jgi:PIN domain nuclease of toxin-antitoxin system